MPRVVVNSQFFLDPELWEDLRGLLPALLETRPALHVWSAGCYVGKEAYSAAILLDEVAPGAGHTIVGSDIDESALERARRGGPYSEADVANLSDSQRRRYLKQQGPPFFVDDRLVEHVEYQRLDLLAGEYPEGVDLLLYRNLETCFDATENAAIYARFRDTISPGGLLFVGAVDRGPEQREDGFRLVSAALFVRT